MAMLFYVQVHMSSRGRVGFTPWRCSLILRNSHCCLRCAHHLPQGSLAPLPGDSDSEGLP